MFLGEETVQEIISQPVYYKYKPKERPEEIVGRSATRQDWIKDSQHMLEIKPSDLYETQNNIQSPINQNLIKFVNSVIDQKIGKLNSVVHQKAIQNNHKQDKSKLVSRVSTYQTPKKLNQQNTDNYYSLYKSGNQSRYSKVNHENKVVHPGIQCDQCNQHPIVGCRYKSKQKDDYDICQSCFQKGHHNPLKYYLIPVPRRDIQKERLRSSIEPVTTHQRSVFNEFIDKVTGYFR